MTQHPTPITVDDLRESEVRIRRAQGRVETQKKRLAAELDALAVETAKHADLIERYGKQHCPGGDRE